MTASKSLFVFFLVASVFTLSSCFKDTSCPESFSQGPYLTLRYDKQDILIVVYENDAGVGENLMIGPENVEIPFDANSDYMSLEVYDRWGEGDSITIHYDIAVVECGDDRYIELQNVKIDRDTSNRLFQYYFMYVSNPDRSEVEISNNSSWAIGPNYGVMIR